MNSKLMTRLFTSAGILFLSLVTSAIVVGLCPIVSIAQGPDADRVLVGQRQPRAGTPEVGLSDADKLLEGSKEMFYFEGQTAHINFVPSEQMIWSRTAGQITRGQRYTIYKDARDPFLAVKEAGVIAGIRILTDRGIRLPSNLKIYLTDKSIKPELGPGCLDAQGKEIRVTFNGGSSVKCQPPQTIAIKRGRRWEPVANIIIATTEPTTAGALSGSGYKGYDKTTITIIHEIGHILHERHAGEFFWTDALAGSPVSSQSPISGYGASKKREFVAETFTALVLGMPNLSRFSAEYKKYRGPDAYLFVLP